MRAWTLAQLGRIAAGVNPFEREELAALRAETIVSRKPNCREPSVCSKSRRLLQISDYETCGLVDEHSNRFIWEHFRAAQNRSMGQRLYRCHAHKCRKSQVDLAKFIAVVLKIGPDESIGFAIEGFYILKASRARNLLCKDAMQLGVDAMRLDRYGD